MKGLFTFIGLGAMSSAPIARAPSFFVLGLALILTGCEFEAESEPLRVGILVWPPYELAYLARDLGYFDGGNIALVDYESPAVAQRAYREGAIDVVAVTSHYLLDLAQTSDDHRVVLVIDTSFGGDVLMSRPEIRSLADLEGAHIAMESGSLGAYMLLRALDHAGLGLDDVTRVSLDIPEQEAKYLAGEVDAIITFEPIRTRLIERGARVLFDSSEIPDEIVDVLLAREETIQKRGTDMGVLVDGWLQALDYLRENPQAAAVRMAPREQITPGELLEALELVRLPGRSENESLLGGHEPALRESLEVQLDTMLRSGMLSKAVPVDRLMDARFVRNRTD